MSFLIGTTENHKDLMNITRQFLEGYGVITYPVAYAGTGNGPIYKPAAPPPGVSEVWTLVCTVPGGHKVAQFSVTGSVSGVQAIATVGTFYDNGLIEFVIQAGGVDFALTDQFDITVTQSTMASNGEEWAQNRWSPPCDEVETSTFDFPNNCLVDNNASLTSKLGVSTGILHIKFPDATAFNRYEIRSRFTGFVAGNAPRDWTLEWSDDGTNWTVEDTQVAQSFGNSELKSYTISTARHIWWRLNITDNNGGSDIEFSQLRMRTINETEDFNCLSEESWLLQGQGLAGTDEIYIGAIMSESILSPFFNWVLAGMTAYEPTAKFSEQPGQNTEYPRYVSNDNTMQFWLTGNGRYVHLTTKISTDYTGMYMGLLLPYSQPPEYPYPLIIAGGSGGPVHYTSVSDNHRMFSDPGPGACFLKGPGGEWLEVINISGVTRQDDRGIWPWFSGSSNWYQRLNKISDGIDGTYVLYPALLLEVNQVANPLAEFSPNAYGEMQDVFCVSGSNNSAENIIVVDGVNYIVFQNIFRTLFADFYAVRLEQ